MKYIVVSNGQTEVIVVFPQMLVHKDMAMYVACNMATNHGWNPKEINVVSAGFVDTIGHKLECYGKSESLGVGSKLGDSELLRASDYCSGDRDSAMAVCDMEAIKKAAV